MNTQQAIKEWANTDHNKLIHFFGEMDLDLTKNIEENGIVARNISENCGYFVERRKTISKEYLILYGREGEQYLLVYENKILTQVIDKTTGTYYFMIDGEFPSIPEYYGYKGGF